MNDMYRCVIIDDETRAIEGLKKYITKIDRLVLVETYTDPVLALSEISKGEKLDLILMDVDMPDISGIELAGLIRHMTDKLVLTTAHTKYGYQAFGIRANDYLLKPFSLAAFIDLINRLLPPYPIEHTQLDNNNNDFFFVKSKEDGQKLVKVDFSSVVAAESKLNYVQLHISPGKNLLTYMSLSEMAKELNNDRGFIQFQRSFILNRSRITTIDGNTITMDNNQKVTVGDYYKKEFNTYVAKHLIRGKRRNEIP